MKPPRQFVIWGTAALLSLISLLIVMRLQHREVQRRVAVQVAAKPVSGSMVFRSKGCVNCHGNSGAGTEFGPALRNSSALTSLPKLVTAMWNHAPRMWQAMQARHLPYPTLSYEETSQLVTYLYTSGYSDPDGDVRRGEQVFAKMKCIVCHDHRASSGETAPSLLAIGDPPDPLSWTQVLWNHARAMQQKMTAGGMDWPKFQASDVRDLFAYVRHVTNNAEDDPADVTGDPDHGWQLFQEKGCIRCHSLSPDSTTSAPSFGADRPLPPTFADFGADMLNHFPMMEKTMDSHQATVPHFSNHDVADIAIFLYSLHYFEPTGSPQVGNSVFRWRGCNQCHGDTAEGAAFGPPLRGRGQAYTAVRLATALWAHGGRMYESAQKHDQPWPTLQDSDIGHLLTFLNTSPEQ